MRRPKKCRCNAIVNFEHSAAFCFERYAYQYIAHVYPIVRMVRMSVL